MFLVCYFKIATAETRLDASQMQVSVSNFYIFVFRELLTVSELVLYASDCGITKIVSLFYKKILNLRKELHLSCDRKSCIFVYMYFCFLFYLSLDLMYSLLLDICGPSLVRPIHECEFPDISFCLLDLFYLLITMFSSRLEN